MRFVAVARLASSPWCFSDQAIDPKDELLTRQMVLFEPGSALRLSCLSNGFDA
jgi:hypothetical protein